MKSFISNKQLLISFLIVGIFANVLFVEAKGKRKNKPAGEGSTAKPGESGSTGKPGQTTTTHPGSLSGTSTTTGKPNGTTTSGKPGGPSTTGKPGGSTTTGKPGGSATTGKPGGSTTTGKPGGSTTTGKPGGSTTTGKPSGSTTPGSDSSTGKPATTSNPDGKNSTTTLSPDDEDKKRLEEMNKLQKDEHLLLQHMNDQMKAWMDFIERHKMKSLNKHTIYDIHNKYCDRMVEIYKDSPKQRDYSRGPVRKFVRKVHGLHTITI